MVVAFIVVSVGVGLQMEPAGFHLQPDSPQVTCFQHGSKWNHSRLKLNPGRGGVSSSPRAQHVSFVFAFAVVVAVAVAVAVAAVVGVAVP